MGRFGVELLLVTFGVVTVLGFLLTYCISVQLNHVNPYLPYISDTGGKPPESCVFSFVCSISIFVELLIIWIRYRMVRTFYCTQLPSLKYCNTFGLIVGIVCSIGFLLVADFQDDNVLVVHFIGAFAVFIGGLLYQWTQSFITFRVYKSGLADHVGAGWVVAQVIISILSLLFFVLALVFSLLAEKFRHKESDQHGTFHWSKSDGGFAYHVISTTCEWAMSMTLLLFFLTFHPDFKRVKLDFIVTRRHSHLDSYSSIVNDENTPLTL